VRFLGRLPDPDVAQRLARCEALLVPGAEDLGIAVVEAQASGRPPIVLAAGGALETVTDGVTGIHVPAPDPALFADAIVRARATDWDTGTLTGAARRLDTPRFLSRIDGLVADAIARRMPS
jgi:glycosyltransferase involved in cell wall biosynthesis